MNRPVLIDCDGVVADFVGSVLDFINSKHRTSFTYKDVTGSIQNLRPYYDKDTEDFIESEGFVANINPIKDSIDPVKLLIENEKVMFVTSPYMSKTWVYERILWLGKHFGVTRDDIIVARNKRYVEGKILIDDKIKNVENWVTQQGRRGEKIASVVFATPHNEDFEESNLRPIVRTNDWNKILKLISNI